MHEEERNSWSNPTSNWWYSIAVSSSSRFEGVLLVDKDDIWWMAWTSDVISKERRLRPPNYVGALSITNGKIHTILSF